MRLNNDRYNIFNFINNTRYTVYTNDNNGIRKQVTMTDKPRIILEGKSLGEYFELIIKNKKLKDKLYAKEQECEELRQGYAELTEIVSPYMDDFTGYNEELGGFDIVLCVKQLLEQLDQLKEQLKAKEQILTEIKEIAEGFCNACKEFEPHKCKENNCIYCNYNKILQLINEVKL